MEEIHTLDPGDDGARKRENMASTCSFFEPGEADFTSWSSHGPNDLQRLRLTRSGVLSIAYQA